MGEEPTAPNRLVGMETMSGMAADTGIAEHNRYLVDRVDVLLKDNERLNQDLQVEHARNDRLCDQIADLEADLDRVLRVLRP